MKVLVFIPMLICASKAGELMLLDEIETYLNKFVLHRLTEDEDVILHDLFEILRMPELVPAILKNKQIDYRKSYIPSSLVNFLKCTTCRSMFGALFTGIGFGLSDENLIETVTNLCMIFKIQNRNVCRGAVELNLPIITYIIRHDPGATSRAFCAFIMQTSHADVCPHSDERFDWTVKLPAVPESAAAPQTNHRPLKVAILTDVHVDPLYEAYGVADCDEPTCCRKGQRPRVRRFDLRSTVDKSLYERIVVEKNGEKFLNLSIAAEIRRGIALGHRIEKFENTPDSGPAGYWGDYRKCDTPIWAYDDVIDRIAETHQGCVLYDILSKYIFAITFIRYKYLLPLPLPQVYGESNKDTKKLYYKRFAPKHVVQEHNTTWLYESLADKWHPYLTDEAKASMLERGGFSLSPTPGFKVIVLNNNVPQRYNWWLVFEPLDAKKHLNWLIEELYQSELAGEKVHILAHIPPGAEDLTHTWTREYNRIVNRFSATIAAEFNGHEHSDQLKLFYSPDGSPINVAWGGGGVTTYSDYNPNYKIVDIDSSTFAPTSMQSYSYNMTEANMHPDRRPQWFELYDLKNSFDLPDLSPASIGNLITSMSKGGKFLDLYSAYFSKLTDVRWAQCDQECKITNLCNIVITVLWDRRKCQNITSLLLSNTT